MPRYLAPIRLPDESSQEFDWGEEQFKINKQKTGRLTATRSVANKIIRCLKMQDLLQVAFTKRLWPMADYADKDGGPHLSGRYDVEQWQVQPVGE